VQSTQLLVCRTVNAGCVVCEEASQCPYALENSTHGILNLNPGVKVSPPSLDGRIAACKYPGNHVPPPLEISPVPEILCWKGTLAQGICACSSLVSTLLLLLRMSQSTQLLVCGTANARCVVCGEASHCPYAWAGKFHAWNSKL
jgi:hypothetical protein